MGRRKRIAWITATVVLMALLAIHLWVPRPLFRTPTSTVLADSHGELIGARISADQQWRFPESDSVSDKFARCIIAFEDRRFRYHPGIDPIATVRALLHNLRQGHVAEGGSTLTMQVARMARGNQSRNLLQKAIEALWAIDIELTYSKDEILRMYASNAPFGGNTVGIDAAAWRYFGRDAHNLSWAENATLAVLPNAPSLIHLGRNREALRQKRDALLRRLMDDGTLTPHEYQLATSEPLPEAPLPIPNQAPHLLDRLTRQHAGQRTQCTIDLQLQQQVQDIADRYSASYKANYISDIGIVVADVETGEVLAYVGNSSQPTATSQVDNVMSQRSTGSLLKPLLYAAMMSDGVATPRMIFADTPLNLNGFTPTNFSKTYRGIVPADEAVTRSLNVPLVRMLSMYGIGRFMSILRWLGMTTLHYDEDHYGASIILGGAEGTLWDMTGMYASLSRTLSHYAGLGQRYDQNDIHPLRLVATSSGRSENDAPRRPAREPRITDTQRLNAASIWYAYEAMSALNRPEEEADWQNFSSMKRVAWKTGTSWGSRDAWSIGTTQRYAVGVWVGNSTGEGRAGLTGVGYASPVMFDVFTLLESSPWFEEPTADMQVANLCSHSGHLASGICADVVSEWMPRSCVGTTPCPYCRRVHLSADGAWQVNSTGEPVSQIRTESRFVLPPTQEYYYAHHTTTYQPLPPLRPDCQTETKDHLQLISPEHGSTVVLPRNFGGRNEKLVLKAACRDADATLFWHLDDNYLGQTHGLHEMAAEPSPGDHWLTIVDGNGVRKTIRFTVR